MQRAFILFVIFLKISFSSMAGNDSLEIFKVNTKTVEVSPGSTINIVIMLKNGSVNRKDFYLKMKTPDNLNHGYDSVLVTVEDQSQEMKIFSFYIQETMKSGKYSIHVDAYNPDNNNSKIGDVDIPFIVKPRYDILVQVRGTPRYVYAGSKVTVEFVVQNLSNAKASVFAEIVIINQVVKKSFTIEADSFVVIPVTATTTKDITSYIRNSISMTAMVEEDPEIKSNASGIFDVLPFNQEKFDAYKRIPIRITSLMMYNSQFPDNNFGAMYNIQGGGILSKKKKSSLEFLLRGPDRQGNPILGTSDAYYIKYVSEKAKFVAGDNVYALSQLTEGSRNGRGVDYEWKGKKMSMGSFVNFPRFYPELKQIYSVYGSYYPSKKLRFNTGFLNKEYAIGNQAQLMTASGTAKISSGANVEFEYAMGQYLNQLSKAYATSLEINYFKSRAFFNYTEADKIFPGYLSNTRYISTGLNTSLIKRITLSANYNLNNFNMALDTIYTNAPYSNNLNLSLGYAFGYSTSLSLGVYKSGREDIQIPQRFKYDETSLRLTFQSKINNFEMRMYGSYGKMNNLGDPQQGELNNIANGEISLDYKLNQHFFINGFVSYVGSQQYLVPDYTLFFYGGVVNITYPKINVEFQYQNNYEIVEYYRNRSLISLKTNYAMGTHHELSIGLNYFEQNRSLNNTQILAMLSYTYILRAPLAKRDDIGSLQGKVINKGVDKVEGIVFSIDGNIAMTDKQGNFEFKAITTGSHMLFMDNANSGLNTIAEIPGPYKIEIVAGEKYIFTVALTKSADIKGKIILEEDVKPGEKGYVPLSEELSTLIIEASSENEVFRLFSNADKTFSFQDLRPGKWKVKIYDRGIPKGYKLIKDEYFIELKPEMTEILEVVIKKSSRKIQFQTH